MSCQTLPWTLWLHLAYPAPCMHPHQATFVLLTLELGWEGCGNKQIFCLSVVQCCKAMAGLTGCFTSILTRPPMQHAGVRACVRIHFLSVYFF